MASIETFKRIEKKYMITREQQEKLMEVIKDRIVPDEHADSGIRVIVGVLKALKVLEILIFQIW